MKRREKNIEIPIHAVNALFRYYEYIAYGESELRNIRTRELMRGR